MLDKSWLKYSNIPLTFADLSLTEVIPFVNHSGYFIGIMTGLCELVSFTDKNVKRGCIHIVKNNPGVVISCQSPVRNKFCKNKFPHTQFTTSNLFLHYGFKLDQHKGLTIQEQTSDFVDLYFQ